MNLKIDNFFRYYMFHCNAMELTVHEQTIARICSIAIGILTVGLVHLICRIAFYSHSFKIQKTLEPKVESVVENVHSPLKNATNSQTKSNPQIVVKSPKTETQPQEQSQKSSSPKIESVQTPQYTATIIDANSLTSSFLTGTATAPKTPKTPAPDAPKEELLPDLKDLHFEDDDPMMQEMDRKKLLDCFWADMMLGGGEDVNAMEPDELEGGLNDDLCDILLADWINEKPGVTWLQIECANPDARELIDQRIQLFDEKIQLKKRIQQLCSAEKKHWLKGVHIDTVASRVKDLIPSWNESPLKYELMMQNELLSMTISDMKNIEDKDKDIGLFLKKTIWLRFSDKNNIDAPAPIIHDEIGKCLLLDIIKLPFAKIDELADKLPSIVFAFLPTNTLRQVDFAKFITRIDKTVFDFIFSFSGIHAASTFMPKLSCEQIYILSIAGFLSSEHWYCLNLKQIKQLDFSQFNINKAIIDAIFGCHRANISQHRINMILKSLTEEQLNKINPFLREEIKALLPKKSTATL